MSVAELKTSSDEKPSASRKTFDVEEVRKDFPILSQCVNGHPLVYLDNAATTQKPNAVIDAISDYYRGYNSNVHRGAHSLSDQATVKFEESRNTVARFIGSPNPSQVIWTRGTTESINLVAMTWGRNNIADGDVILVSAMEHHSNIGPWQILALEKNARVVPMAVTRNGDIDLSALDTLLADSIFSSSVKIRFPFLYSAMIYSSDSKRSVICLKSGKPRTMPSINSSSLLFACASDTFISSSERTGLCTKKLRIICNIIS